MNILYLKVKLMSLAAEAKIIRKIENKYLAKNRWARQLLNLEKTIEKCQRQVARLRNSQHTDNFRVANIEEHIEWLKQKANRVRPIESNISKDEMNYFGLHDHRVIAIRQEARATNIAYGFLRGHAFRDIESSSRIKPNWTKIVNMVMKYGAATKGELVVLKEKFDKWKEEATK
jgi:hypothetical protein